MFRKFLWTAAAVVGGCALLWVVLGLTSLSSGLAGGVARENGDVNGDGDIDLADPVYLLNFLFQAGPPPVAVAGSASGAVYTSSLVVFPFIGVTEYLGIGDAERSTDETVATMIVPRDGELRNLHVYSPEGSGPGTVTLRVNGVDTPLTVDVGGVVSSNTAEMFEVSQGDRLTIKLHDNPTAVFFRVRVSFEL